MNDYTCGMNVSIRSEARDDITVVIFQIYFGVPRCTVKIFVCCDVQCERRGLWKTSETCTVN